jgi:Holliday junction resolvase RusA-like endonuclease
MPQKWLRPEGSRPGPQKIATCKGGLLSTTPQSISTGSETAPDSIEIVLDVPFPPSVNHIWRRSPKRVFRSARYERWMKRADAAVMAAKQYPRRKIIGHFEAHILLDRDAGHGDLDNRIKAVLDWTQSRDIILDDKDCQSLRIEWCDHDQAPQGCRVILRSTT